MDEERKRWWGIDRASILSRRWHGMALGVMLIVIAVIVGLTHGWDAESRRGRPLWMLLSSGALCVLIGLCLVWYRSRLIKRGEDPDRPRVSKRIGN